MALLQVTDLRKAYRLPDGSLQPVVDVPDFAIDAAAEAAIRGGSGSGKTTFLNLVAGIVRADSGSIELDGVEITGLPEARRDRLRARSIGCVFQTFHLLGGYTALENVVLAMRLAGSVDQQFARALLARVGLEDRMSHRPAQMSVGQQQRVAVARALANRPALVLADEPTGNLDPRSASAALAILREVCAENHAALLLVTHDAAVLDVFERVVDFADMNRALARVQESP